MIKFHFNDTYLCCTTENQTENTRTQVNSYLKSVGFSWDKKDFCWKLFGLYIDANIIQGAKFLDDVEGSTRRLLQFKRELERRAWVPKTGVTFNPKMLKHPPLPSNRRKQLRAINNMITHEAHIAKMGVGSGKTYCSLSAFNHLEEAGRVDAMLVVTLGSVLINWRDEILKFTWINEDEIFVMDSKKNRSPWDSSKNYKVILCTYDGLKVLINDIYKKKGFAYTARKPERKYCFFEEFNNWSDRFLFIIDEAHFINNKSSINNHYVTALSLISTHLLELTGSLFRKFSNEIYFHMNLVCPEIVGNYPNKSNSYQNFLRVTAELLTSHSTNIKETIEDKMEELNKVFYQYITVSDATLNVEVSHVKMEVELSDKHIAFYKNVSKIILENSKDEEEGVSTSSLFNAFPNYSMALADPLMLLDKFPEELKDFEWDLEENQKFQIARSILDKHKDEKVIIWLRNPFVLDLLEEALQEYKPLKYHGKVRPPKGMTKAEHKQLIVNTFNGSDENRVLLCNPSSLGTGQNIQGANIDVFWNIPHNVIDDYIQALGRTARPTQKKDIIHYMLVAKNTIDETAFHTLSHRSYLNDLKAKYKFLSREQIRDMLLGKIID